MDMTIEQLVEQIIYFGKIAGAISAIVGVVVLLFSPQIKKIKERRKENEERQTQILEKLTSIETQIHVLTDDVAALQMDALEKAHDQFTDQGWIDSRRLAGLTQWYKSYRAKGHNHLAERWLDDMENLASSPSENNM